MAHPINDEDHLLRQLTVEGRREMNRLYQRRFVARRNEQERLNRSISVEEMHAQDANCYDENHD
jgi:hypothetical protein